MSSTVLTPLNNKVSESSTKRVVRDSNIELLRILAVMGVIVLHYNGNVAFNAVKGGTFNQYILFFLEGLFICAVNLFVLISGYFSSVSQKRKAIKPIELVAQVIAFRVLFYLLFNLPNNITIGGFLDSLVPNNYYATLFITLYLISPYINIVLNKLNDKQLTVFALLLFFLFSICPTVADCLSAKGYFYSGIYTVGIGGSVDGYSFVNFAIMYVFGAVLRRREFNPSIWILLILFGGLSLISFFGQIKAPFIIRDYCNPIVIALSVVAFLLFKKINLKSKVTNRLSKATFTCFLIHGVFLGWLGIEKHVNGSPLILIIHIVVSCVAIFLISWTVWEIYDFATKGIFKFFSKKLVKLDELLSPEYKEV